MEFLYGPLVLMFGVIGCLIGHKINNAKTKTKPKEVKKDWCICTRHGVSGWCAKHHTDWV